MKRILIILSPALLTGCPSWGDRVPENYPADVTLRNGEVCVTVTPQGDEKLEAISVYRLGDADKREITFFDKLIDISPNQCIPNQGYIFTEGPHYYFSVKLTSPEKSKAGNFPFSRNFVAEFSLEKVNNQLQVVPVSG